jgi:chromosome segregation ATPase
VQNQINEFVGQLRQFYEQVGQYEDIQEKKNSAQAEFTSVKRALDEARGELKKVQVDLTTAQTENVRRYDAAIYAKQSELAGVQKRLDEASDKYEKLVADIKDREAHHATVLAGINALRSRLEGRAA